MPFNEVAEIRSGSALGLPVQQLVTLAAEWLMPMFDKQTKLFCYRFKPGSSGSLSEGLSQRYSIMTLLGLHRFAATGRRIPIDIRPTVDALLADRGWINNIGDLGLMLWLVAVAAPEHLAELYFSFRIDTALARYRDVREMRTMELAWFLSGMSHAAETRELGSEHTAELSRAAYQLIVKNQGRHGIFGHQGVWRSPRGILRGRVGSFADQVYPIYALAQFGSAYKIHDALLAAQRCAEAICRLQGPLGQWWWHYDAATGRVVERYPVYSVHQDGMAPMALFALGGAAHLNFSDPIHKGLQWLYGKNELGIPLRDESSGVIWRNIRRRPVTRKLGVLSDFVRHKDNANQANSLEILFETRPYELGWLLYAFADRCEGMGTAAATHHW